MVRHCGHLDQVWPTKCTKFPQLQWRVEWARLPRWLTGWLYALARFLYNFLAQSVCGAGPEKTWSRAVPHQAPHHVPRLTRHHQISGETSRLLQKMLKPGYWPGAPIRQLSSTQFVVSKSVKSVSTSLIIVPFSRLWPVIRRILELFIAHSVRGGYNRYLFSRPPSVVRWQ